MKILKEHEGDSVAVKIGETELLSLDDGFEIKIHENGLKIRRAEAKVYFDRRYYDLFLHAGFLGQGKTFVCAIDEASKPTIGYFYITSVHKPTDEDLLCHADLMSTGKVRY